MLITSLQSECDSPFFCDLSPIKEKVMSAWGWSISILNKHTDLISSVGILAITTCLLAAKIFENTPPLLTQAARVIFDFGGIIWLNVQIRDLLKSCCDLGRAIENQDWTGVVETAVKVAIKSVNVLLTCCLFAAAVIAACGFPEITAAIYVGMIPVGLVALVANILSDIRDYSISCELIDVLKRINKSSKASEKKAKLMICFLDIVKPVESKDKCFDWTSERKLADRLVRQIDNYSLENFQEKFEKKQECQYSRLETLFLFDELKRGIKDKKVSTEDNLSLNAFFYLSRAIFRAFPDSLAEMVIRWTSSVLFTNEIIKQKIRHVGQVKRLDRVQGS